MTAKKTKVKTAYWAVFEGKKKVKMGTFMECWKHLVKKWGAVRLSTLHDKGIRVGRTR